MYPLVKQSIDVKRSITSIQMMFRAMSGSTLVTDKAVTARKMTFVCMNENPDQSNPFGKISVSAVRERPQTLSFSGKLRLSLLQVLELRVKTKPTFTASARLLCWWEHSLEFASHTALDQDAASLAH